MLPSKASASETAKLFWSRRNGLTSSRLLALKSDRLGGMDGDASCEMVIPGHENWRSRAIYREVLKLDAPAKMARLVSVNSRRWSRNCPKRHAAKSLERSTIVLTASAMTQSGSYTKPNP